MRRERCRKERGGGADSPKESHNRDDGLLVQPVAGEPSLPAPKSIASSASRKRLGVAALELVLQRIM